MLGGLKEVDEVAERICFFAWICIRIKWINRIRTLNNARTIEAGGL